MDESRWLANGWVSASILSRVSTSRGVSLVAEASSTHLGDLPALSPNVP